MPTTDPITTVLTQLTTIDTASAAIQAVVSAYPASPQTASGIATLQSQLSIINNATQSLRALIAATQGGTTPTLAPTPPPPPPPTPVPPSSGGVSVLRDDFTSYTSTADLQAAITTNIGGKGSPATALYTDGWFANLVSLDTSVLYNGHPTMKFLMPGGKKDCPALWAKLPVAQEIVFVRAKVRFSPGFTTTGTISGGNAFKLFGWGNENYDGSGRLEIANTNQYQLYWNVQSKSGGALVGGGAFGNGGTITSEWSDSHWYDYILKVDRKTGLISAWFGPDGVLPPLKVSPTKETMKDGSQMPRVTSVGFAIEFNQVRAGSQSQALWIGQWEVIDGVKSPNPYGLTAG